MMDRLLVLARHGQSEWNLKNLFTGWKDVALMAHNAALTAPRAKIMRSSAVWTSSLRSRWR
jgi:2,3-bisphosphoglycerate-dependent phosphoglycerate mutase